MKIKAQPFLFVAALAAALVLSACGKADNTDSATSSTAPPAVEPAPTPPPATPMAPETMSMVSFASVELGSTVDANNKIAASGTTFAPNDSVFASVDTVGNGDATLAAKWTYQDGQVVNEDSKTIHATGPATTSFMINKPGGLPAGDYKVAITLNGTSVATKDFSVK